MWKTAFKKFEETFCKNSWRLLLVTYFHIKSSIMNVWQDTIYGVDLCWKFLNYYKTPTQVFFCEYCEIFKSAYFEQHLETAASVNLGELFDCLKLVRIIVETWILVRKYRHIWYIVSSGRTLFILLMLAFSL